MSTIIKAPEDFTEALLDMPSVFLAGSIEMGEAEDWQAEIEDGVENMDIVVLNPRRDDWDSTWKQTIDNPQFREQVEWELAAQEAADCIAMYFDPDTKSPITLLELGLFNDPSRLIVCCPEGFWRKGNVDIVCERYGLSQVDTLDELIEAVRDRLEGNPRVETARLITLDELRKYPVTGDPKQGQHRRASFARESQLSIADLAGDVNHRTEDEDPFKKIKKKEKEGRDKNLNPSVHEMANESYHNENQYEDVDLHLGRREVSVGMGDVVASFGLYEYPRELDTPYTEPVQEMNNTKEYGSGHGPFSESFEDKTMTSYAMEDFDKDGVGQIDVTPDPNERIENPWFDTDVSIPRG